MSEIKCPNCGAMIDPHEPKCPYCGYINPSGAQEQFMDKLEQNRLKLDNVDEEAAGLYEKEMKKKGRRLAITAAVTVVVIAAVLLFAKFKDRLFYSSFERTAEEEVAEIAWQKEHFPELTKLYDAGKYDELLDLYSEYLLLDDIHDLWYWEHYAFVDALLRFDNLKNSMRSFDQYVENKDTDLLASIFYGAARFFYRDYESDTQITQQDLEILAEAHNYAITILHDRFHFTDEDMDAIRSDIYGFGYVDFKACQKVVEDNMKKIGE